MPKALVAMFHAEKSIQTEIIWLAEYDFLCILWTFIVFLFPSPPPPPPRNPLKKDHLFKLYQKLCIHRKSYEPLLLQEVCVKSVCASLKVLTQETPTNIEITTQDI